MRENSKHLLKILNGPHRGAEVALQLGELTLGSSDECDIILTDRMIAPRHARLTVRADGVGLTPLADGVLLEGKALTEARNKIDPYQNISLGSTQLMLGPTEGVWPALLPKDYTTPAGTSATATAAAAAEKSATATNNPSPAAPATDSAPKSPAAPAPAPQAERKTPWFALSLVLVFALGLALLAYAFLGAHSTLPEPDPIDLAKAKIESMGLKGRIHFERRNNRILAEGYCNDIEQRKVLLTELVHISPAFMPRIFSREGVANDSRGVLTALGIPASVTSPEDGLAVINAIVLSRAAWERASESLRTDVPGLKKVEDKGVRTLDEIAASMRDTLSKQGLTGLVTISPCQGGFLATGNLPQNLEKAWIAARTAISDMLGSGVVFLDQTRYVAASQIAAKSAAPVTDAEAEANIASADFHVESIIGGDKGWVSVRNGHKFFLGAELPNGFTLIEIKPDHAVLLRGSERLEVSLGGDMLSEK